MHRPRPIPPPTRWFIPVALVIGLCGAAPAVAGPAPQTGGSSHGSETGQAVTTGRDDQPNQAPVAVNDPDPSNPADPPSAYTTVGNATTDDDHTVDLPSPGVLVNDSDPDNQPSPLLAVQDAQDTQPSFGALTLNSDGSFSYTPHAGVCNATDQFTYKAFDGDLYSDPATVTITIQTLLQPTKLTLQPSATDVVYGHSVFIKAHLTEFSPSARISIYQRPAGSTRQLVLQGRPGTGGNLVAKVTPSRRTTYSASSEDNCYDSEDNGPQVVRVAPLVEGHMVGFFERRGSYALYHAGGRAPHYRATVTPNHPGAAVKFAWQRRAGDTWRDYFVSTEHLSPNSTIDVYLTSGVVPTHRYRVRIKFLADGDHLARAASWSYFKAV